MNNAVENKNDGVNGRPVPSGKKDGSGKMNIYLVAVLVLAFVGLIAYQFLSCASCYVTP